MEKNVHQAQKDLCEKLGLVLAPNSDEATIIREYLSFFKELGRKDGQYDLLLAQGRILEQEGICPFVLIED